MQQKQNSSTNIIDFHINYYVKSGVIIKRFLWYFLVRYTIEAKDLFGKHIEYDKVIWIPIWRIIRGEK